MKIFIQGNGEHLMPAPMHADAVVTFNGRQPLCNHDVHVDVRMVRTVLGEYRVAFQASNGDHQWTELEACVNDALDRQTHELGCLPSTGFCLVHSLWDSNHHLHIGGVNFDPSLVRAADLTLRQPMPQAFHNWLGERRMMLRRGLHKRPAICNWSLLDDSRWGHQPKRAVPARVAVHHSRLIEALTKAAMSGSVEELAGLSVWSVEASADLLDSAGSVSALEGFFHLDRTSVNTRNWWLYDAQASNTIEALCRELREAQQRAFQCARSLNHPGISGRL